MAVNYLGSVYPSRAVISTMKERRMGRIVFVSSQAGQLGLFGYTAYSPTKFALRGLAEALQMEVCVQWFKYFCLLLPSWLFVYFKYCQVGCEATVNCMWAIWESKTCKLKYVDCPQKSCVDRGLLFSTSV